jgi:hypothetical protein
MLEENYSFVFAQVFGWIALISGWFSFFPQVLENFIRKE